MGGGLKETHINLTTSWERTRRKKEREEKKKKKKKTTKQNKTKQNTKPTLPGWEKEKSAKKRED